MSKPVAPIAVPRKGKVLPQLSQDGGGSFSEKVAERKALYGELLVTVVTGVEARNRAKMLSMIKRGLRFSAISHLEAAFEASQKEIAALLSIAPTTLTRRKKEGLLHADESDRVVRLARLKDSALALTRGDDAAAISWLKTPLPILGGESPLEHAGTELGARDVEDLIGRLRHGVFS